MKKIVIKMLFSKREIALINEALKESFERKYLSLSDTNIEDALMLNKSRKLFKTKYNLYN